MKNLILLSLLLSLASCNSSTGTASPPANSTDGPTSGGTTTGGSTGGATSPLTVTINQSTGQADPATTFPVSFRVVFSRAISAGTFTASDISQIGTVSPITWTITNSGDSRNFTLSGTSNSGAAGTIRPTLPAGRVSDSGGATNMMSTATDNFVTYQVGLNSSGAVSFANTAMTNSSDLRVITFQNTSSSAISGCGGPVLVGANAGDFSIVSHNCAASISAGASCQINVKSVPTSVGTKTAEVNLVCGATTARAPLSVTATSGLEWSTPVDQGNFGTVKVGLKSAPMELLFRNETEASYTSCTSPVVNSSVFTIESDDCTASMSGFTQCKVVVSASPVAAASTAATISRNCDGFNVVHSLSVTGSSASVVDIVAGGELTCLVLSAGNPLCFGPLEGHMLLSSTEPKKTHIPQPIPLTGVTKLTMGTNDNSFCAWQGSTTPKCWGQNSSRTVGSGSASTTVTSPTTPTGLVATLDIVSGRQFRCALASNKSVRCWGWLQSGLAGDGVTASNITYTPVTGPAGPFEELSASDYNICGRTSTGTVQCWGLINGSNVLAPTTVSGLSNVIQLASGGDFHCALISGGTVSCWGGNSRGQLGNGTNTNSPLTPVAVTGLTSVTALAKGNVGHSKYSSHMCALISGGTVQCWGENTQNQLGSGFTNSNVPVAVAGLSGVSKVVRGNFHTCALRTNGSVACFGRNMEGQLGRGFTLDGYPIEITNGPGNYDQVAIGKNYSCALNSGNVHCWGPQAINGTGITSFGATAPTSVTGFSNVTDLSIGAGGGVIESVSGLTICGKDNLGDVKCMGRSINGSLGLGTTSIASAPTTVPAWAGGVDMSAGGTFRCVYGGGNASCAGGQSSGANGSTSATDTTNVVPVTAVSGYITQMSGSNHVNFALLNDKTLWAFGGLSGNAYESPIGDGVNNQTLTGVNILSNVDQVAAFSRSACAIHNAGKLSCWGIDVGSDDLTQTRRFLSPTPVGQLSTRTITQVTGGQWHICALDSTGVVWCWGGKDSMGGAGTGKIGTVTSPKPVLGFSAPVTDLWKPSADAQHSCAITSDNKLWCWGMHESFFTEASTGLQYVSGFR